jgi:hypothetical protein
MSEGYASAPQGDGGQDAQADPAQQYFDQAQGAFDELRAELPPEVAGELAAYMGLDDGYDDEYGDDPDAIAAAGEALSQLSPEQIAAMAGNWPGAEPEPVEGQPSVEDLAALATANPLLEHPENAARLVARVHLLAEQHGDPGIVGDIAAWRHADAQLRAESQAGVVPANTGGGMMRAIDEGLARGQRLNSLFAGRLPQQTQRTFQQPAIDARAERPTSALDGWLDRAIGEQEERFGAGGHRGALRP